MKNKDEQLQLICPDVDNEPLKRIEGLRQKLREYDHYYHVRNAPLVSDQEYDALFRELQELEQAYPEAIVPDSPTQRVGAAPAQGFVRIRHSMPMLSLSNTYSLDDIRTFDSRVKAFLKVDEISYLVELKIDGLGVSLEYRDGLLHRAATRGDGIEGEDVTANVRTIKSVPLSMPGGVSVEVRGEVFMPRTTFAALNEVLEEQGRPTFANPRNAAAGSLRQLDPAVTATRGLAAYFYQVITDEAGITFQHQHLEMCAELGLPVAPGWAVVQTLQELEELVGKWNSARHELDFDTDGLVIKVNSLNMQNRLGFVSRSPRWAMAYKYEAEKAVTRLEDVIFQVGRIGTVTPVAVLEPVFLSGSTVSRASLHNQEEVERLGIMIGDMVELEKAGEIIPHIIKVLPENRSGDEKPVLFPTHCPVCRGPLKKDEGMVALRCNSATCAARSLARILHFVSRNAMDIDGIGPALAGALLENRVISGPLDLFDITTDQLIGLPRMAEKSAENVVKAIQNRRQVPLWRLIHGLGIPDVGETAARTLAAYFNEFSAFSGAEYQILLEVPDIGDKTASSIRQYFDSPAGSEECRRITEGIIQFVSEPEGEALALSGKKFLVTGTLEHFTRAEAKEFIRRHGGILSSSVSKNLDYLVAGKAPGGKLKKALETGVKVIDESELLQMAESSAVTGVENKDINHESRDDQL